jgi:ligand-binding sensor domain-containing protein
MAQTNDGYLWMANNGGLVRFDGVQPFLFGRADGANRLKDGKVTQFTAKERRVPSYFPGGASSYAAAALSFRSSG